MQHLSILYSKKSGNADILLNKNHIKAVRRMVFTVVKRTLGLHDTPKPLKGRQVELQNVLAWLIREQRLHGLDEEEVEINIKLDGRPFWGKSFELTQLLSVLWEQEVHA